MINRFFSLCCGARDKTEKVKQVPQKDQKYLTVEMGYYQFLPRAQMRDFTGFYTSNVCECVCGLIEGKEGVAFFHFDKCKDASDLAKMISKDFPSKNIRIHLIGGNMNNAWLPSTYINRSIQLNLPVFWADNINSVSKEGFKEIYNDEEALKLIHQCIMPNTKTFIAHRWRSFVGDFQMLRLPQTETFFQYDYTALDKRLQETSMKADCFLDEPTCSFVINGIVDSRGYQNISDVMSAMQKEGLLTSKVSHVNCKLSADIVVMLNGEVKEYVKDLHPLNEQSASSSKLQRRTHYQFDFSSHEAYLPTHLRQVNKRKPKGSPSNKGRMGESTPLLGAPTNESKKP